MNHIKIITTDHEHEQALSHLVNLMDANPVIGSCEADELDVLAVLIERYEQAQFPIGPPDPIEAIKFRMEQQELINKDLIPYIGSASKVSEVLNGKRKLSLNMIRKLSSGLGISAEVLIRAPSLHVANESKIDWQAFPLAEMRKRGYFEGFCGSLQELKEYAAEQVSSLLSSVPSGLALKPAMLKSSAHLRSNNKEMDNYALWAWQVRILQKAQEEQLANCYETGTVNLDWMKNLAQLSWSKQGPLLAKEYLNRSGIHLIFEDHLPKTYLDGAVCLNLHGNPVIALTLRYDRLDNFWFTLMHELAHIALHIDGTETWFIDDLDFIGSDPKEQEANELAQEALIPNIEWVKLIDINSSTVTAMAKKLNISPCVIAGRLRYEKHYSVLGKLFREKVRVIFSN